MSIKFWQYYIKQILLNLIMLSIYQKVNIIKNLERFILSSIGRWIFPFKVPSDSDTTPGKKKLRRTRTILIYWVAGFFIVFFSFWSKLERLVPYCKLQVPARKFFSFVYSVSVFILISSSHLLLSGRWEMCRCQAAKIRTCQSCCHLVPWGPPVLKIKRRRICKTRFHAEETGFARACSLRRRFPGTRLMAPGEPLTSGAEERAP